MGAALGESSDLHQLRGLVAACEALDITPFTEDEIRARSPHRQGDLERVIDLASTAVTQGRLMPSQRRERDFTWMRYIVRRPGGTNLGVGLRRDQDAAASGWAWVRLHKDTPNARQAGEVLVSRFPDRAVMEPNGATWMSLNLPHGVSGAAMQQHVSDQLAEILDVLTETHGVTG